MTMKLKMLYEELRSIDHKILYSDLGESWERNRNLKPLWRRHNELMVEIERAKQKESA